MSLTIVQTTAPSGSVAIQLREENATYKPALEALASLFNAYSGLDDPLSLEIRRWTDITVVHIDALIQSGELDEGIRSYAEERITLLAGIIFTALGEDAAGHDYAKDMLSWISSITVPEQQLVRVVREEEKLLCQIASMQWKVAFRLYNACKRADGELKRAVEIRDAAREENRRVMEACLRLRDELRKEVSANISQAKEGFNEAISIERQTAEGLRHDIDYAEERLDTAHGRIDQLVAENNAVRAQQYQTQRQLAALAAQKNKKSCVIQ